jgi:hypothetical protein
MSTIEWNALQNAAASSRMENLPYEQRHYDTIRNILEGKQTLQDYLKEMKDKYGEI